MPFDLKEATMDFIKSLYASNKDIKEYIDRFARDRNIPVDEAMGQQVVKEYIKYKTDKNG